MTEATIEAVDLGAQFNTFVYWFSADFVRWGTLALTAQVIFAARFLSQWVASERRKESVIPASFWYWSLAGGWMLAVYALFRDPVVLVSTAPSVFIYVRNISLVHRSKSKLINQATLTTILAAVGFVVLRYDSLAGWYWSRTKWFWNSEGAWWIAFGLTAQSIFFTRFVWQWIVSERRKQSVVPVGFWYFSLVGGSMLTVYAIFRDAWLIPGQAAGLIVYVRNLMLIHRSNKGRAASGEPSAPASDSEARRAA